MGLSPIMVDKIFEVVDDIHERGHDGAAGRAEREPRAAARLARLRDGLGEVTMSGDAQQLLNDPKVRAAYLGE